MIGPLSYLDVSLLGLAVISGLLAMYRGLGRELLSIISWIVGVGAGAYFYLYRQGLAADVTQQLSLPNPKIAQIGIAVLVGLIVLIVVHLITARISDSILDSSVGVIDRTLGLVFGVVRAFLIVLIPYMFYQHFTPKEAEYPQWVRDSKSLGMLNSASNALKPPLLSVVQRVTDKAVAE
jgi:membrane protein required for colicin V production